MVCGAGGVGSAIVALAAHRGFAPQLVVADLDKSRAERAVTRARENAVNSRTEISVTQLDASSADSVAESCKQLGVTHLLNAVDPRAVMAIFEGCFRAGVTYQDMATSLSVPNPSAPYQELGHTLGEEQFAQDSKWQERGLMALVGMGADPGLSDVFARYASESLFSRIDKVSVRDGGDVTVAGHMFAPLFSPWTVIEECLNPPVIYEKARGWFPTQPFSDPERFVFPEGIGEVECVNVEHEEVFFVPRGIDVGRVDFKYGLGERFIEVLKVLAETGLAAIEPVKVGQQLVSPRELVAAVLPDPIDLVDSMKGKVCVGTLVSGLGKDLKPREVFLYNVVDTEWSRREHGSQAVVWQTAVNATVALELIMTGAWQGNGVLVPEQLPAEPFLTLLTEGYGVSWGKEER
jgi:saccharopine dehydrogenase (NAD+, L-lysine-forming)